MFSTYIDTIPQSTDVPANSQDQILDNFTSLNEQFGVDHVPLIQGFNQGWHNKVTWLDQSAAIPSSLAGQVVGYANKIGAITYPYYKRDAISTVFPLSPIKCAGVFKFNNPGTTGALIGTPWNVLTAALTVSGNNRSILVTMINPMNSAIYPTFASESGISVPNGANIVIDTTYVNNLTFLITLYNNNTVLGSFANATISFMAMEF